MSAGAEQRAGDWLQVRSGYKFWPRDPRPDEVSLHDIAHALSNQCRFAGHVREFYSVAEHCVRVSRLVPDEDALWALLHDAAEAYLVDLPRPIKNLPEFAVYRQTEEMVTDAICKHFGLPREIPASVRYADELLLHAEARDLMPCWPVENVWWTRFEEDLQGFEEIVPWTPREARERFHERFEELTAPNAATEEG